jgi:hypothetical protein
LSRDKGLAKEKKRKEKKILLGNKGLIKKGKKTFFQEIDLHVVSRTRIPTK